MQAQRNHLPQGEQLRWNQILMTKQVDLLVKAKLCHKMFTYFKYNNSQESVQESLCCHWTSHVKLGKVT